MLSSHIAEIEKVLNYVFLDKGLLITAFTHSSYANAERSKGDAVQSYERMAFLGDAVLKTVVARCLYDNFPSKGKGELSYMCSGLVSREALAPVVEDLKLTNYLRMTANFGELSEHLCADLYEAIVCAIFLDGGFEPAKQFVLRTLNCLLQQADKVKHKDCKTLLQEYCQSLQPQKTVTYVLAGKSGADNSPTYKIDLYVDDEYMCSGVGASKKSAEQNCAKKLVTEWRID